MMTLYDDMVKVIQAHTAGKVIESRIAMVHDGNYGWMVDRNPGFNFSSREYRIKPKVVEPFETSVNIPLEKYGVNNETVNLISYTGGGHPDGAWAEITLEFDTPSMAFQRTYRDINHMSNDRHNYRQKLMQLAEACSDHVLGGEHGWEGMEFDHFVSLCRKSCANGNRYLNRLNEEQDYGRDIS